LKLNSPFNPHFIEDYILPRKPRFFVADVTNQIIQRGNNKNAVIIEDEVYRKYLSILNEAATKQGVKIHAYGLYVLACMCYIEMNPVRAQMVTAPKDYKWSCYHSYVRGTYDPVIAEHISYKGLAKSRKKQQENYRDMFLEHLDEKVLTDIRNCVQSGTPLRNNKFKSQIESKLKIKVGYNTRGRQKKL